MHRIDALAMAAAAMLALAPAVQADPWKDESGHGRGGWQRGHGGGPPPWAPAHGYRAKHGGDALPTLISLPDSGLGRCHRDLIGGVLGAAAGGLAGSQIGKGSGNTAAIIAGAVLGGVIGGRIGRTMDEADLWCAGEALEVLPTGRAAEWRNPDTDASYVLEPTETYQTEAGRYCRRYTARAVISDDIHAVEGVACRRSDGSWEIVG